MFSIEKRFQIKYVIAASFLIAVSSFIIGLGIYLAVKSELSYSLNDISEQKIVVNSVMSGINNILMIIIPALLIVSITISYLFLIRITSPITKVIKEIKTIGKGDFSADFDSGKGLEFRELMEAVRETNGKLSSMIGDEKYLIDKMLISVSGLLKELEKEKINKEKIDRIVKELQAIADKILIALSRYKLGK
jgi:methyl-accepting chemotaxis protein